jgi:hypothetical protein
LHKAARHSLEQFPVFRIADSSPTRRIDHGRPLAEARAGLKDQIVQEAAVRVGEELGSQHRKTIVAEMTWFVASVMYCRYCVFSTIGDLSSYTSPRRKSYLAFLGLPQ